MQHDHIRKKKFFNPMVAGFQIEHFGFSVVAEAVCTSAMATCAFFHFLVPSEEN